MWTDVDIEKLFRNYYYNKSILELSEPSLTSHLQLDKVSGGSIESKVEMIAVRRAQAEIELKMVNACLIAMNKDEKEFINLRYFEEYDMKIVAGCIRCCRTDAYQIRRKVLTKSKKLLNITTT
jgi:DNA-directed RNA polymerase specialized sigma subunit